MNPFNKAALALLVCGAWGCNIVDPEANFDGGAVIIDEDTGGGGEVDAGDPEDTGEPPVDAGDCEESERNECGGCDVLDAKVGDPCPGFDCGALTCLSPNELGCDCLQRDGCFVNAGQTACECVQGFEPNGTTTCADVDECAQDVCDERTTCTNSVGGFTCTPCPEGTVDVNGNGTECTPAVEDVEYVEKAETHPGNTSTCIEVACPAGKVALSGGHINDPDIFVNASRTANNGASWLICGFSPRRAEWTVTAACATANVQVGAVQEAQTIAPESGACVEALCPDGTRVVGGGGSWPDSFRPDHSRPKTGGTGWVICGLAGRTGDEVRVAAVCADVATTVIEKREDEVPSEVCVEQGCEGDEVLIGGGGYWDLNRVLTRNTIQTTGAPRQQVCGKNTEPREAWAVAICMPRL
jgi:hypothetical protein